MVVLAVPIDQLELSEKIQVELVLPVEVERARLEEHAIRVRTFGCERERSELLEHLPCLADGGRTSRVDTPRAEKIVQDPLSGLWLRWPARAASPQPVKPTHRARPPSSRRNAGGRSRV